MKFSNVVTIRICLINYFTFFHSSSAILSIHCRRILKIILKSLFPRLAIWLTSVRYTMNSFNLSRRCLMISFIINISFIIWYRIWISCHVYHIIYRMSSSIYWNRIKSPNSINMTTIMILIYSPRLNICLYANLFKIKM
jgi:hypothetical protein